MNLKKSGKVELEEIPITKEKIVELLKNKIVKQILKYLFKRKNYATKKFEKIESFL